MTEYEEELALLRAKTAAGEEPLLSDAHLTSLMSLARRRDDVGLYPSDIGWTPTYDVNAAAAEGWRWKARWVATGCHLTAGDTKLTRSQVYAQFMGMAAMYASQVAALEEVVLYDPTWVINL